MNKKIVTEVIGWYGVVALMAAYMGVSFGYLQSSDASFQVLNATGALGIVIDAVAQKNWQPAVLNVIWGVIALIALIKMLL